MHSVTEKYSYEIKPAETLSTAARVLHLVGSEKRVLELGTASGSMTAALKEHNRCRVVGVEIDAEAAERARPYCERLIVGDIEKLDWEHEFRDERFDVIIAADVLEHLIDPWRCLEQARELLAPGGYLVLSVPNVSFSGLVGAILTGSFPYQETGLLDDTHVRFFTRYELELALLGAGYLPEEWQRVEQYADKSEFARYWHLLSESVQATLTASPEGTTYQFVVRARPVDRAGLCCFLRTVQTGHAVELQESQQKLQESQQKLQESQQQQQIAARELQKTKAVLDERTRSWEHAEKALQEVLASTSWRISRPVRLAGTQLRRTSKVLSFFAFLARHPQEIRPAGSQLRIAWKKGGLPALKNAIRTLPLEAASKDPWRVYRRHYVPALGHWCKGRVELLPRRPLISVLMPTYNPAEPILRTALDSVLAQIYPFWELCIVDDGSSEPAVRRTLEDYATRDGRIKVCFSDANSGIAAATNQALELAHGEFCVLFDHDDLLEQQALLRVAETILAEDPDFIYSDEALIDERGEGVVGFVFRPSFSLELLRSHPYIVHLAAFRTTLLRELGGLDSSLSISQDYDLILRMVERSTKIVHIPEILYLWRQQPASAGHQKKEQVMATSKMILERHLARCGEPATVEDGRMFNFFEVRYQLQQQLKVAIIIPTKNHGDLVRQCIESIERTVRQIPYDIIIIDHASDDPATLDYFRQLQQHQLLRYEGPFNFSAINNWAVSRISDNGYTHYLFCNNDIEATAEGWLERMMELAQKPDIGIVGAALLYPGEDLYQHAGVCVGMYGIAEHYGKWMAKWLPDGCIEPGYGGALIATHELSAVTAACMVMRRDAFEKIGGYDKSLAVGFGDVDLCLRAREAGYRVVYCPHAELVHHESYTRGQSQGEDPHPADSALFKQRWQQFLDRGDPYYNPNLSDHCSSWQIKAPLRFNPQLRPRVYIRQTWA